MTPKLKYLRQPNVMPFSLWRQMAFLRASTVICNTYRLIKELDN